MDAISDVVPVRSKPTMATINACNNDKKPRNMLAISGVVHVMSAPLIAKLNKTGRDNK